MDGSAGQAVIQGELLMGVVSRNSYAYVYNSQMIMRYYGFSTDRTVFSSESGWLRYNGHLYSTCCHIQIRTDLLTS